jgi:hypothetical protein
MQTATIITTLETLITDILESELPSHPWARHTRRNVIPDLERALSNLRVELSREETGPQAVQTEEVAK